MDKGLFFLILGLGCFYLVFDEFAGKRRISKLANFLTPDISIFGMKEKYTEEETDKVNKDAKDLKKKYPTPKLGGF